MNRGRPAKPVIGTPKRDDTLKYGVMEFESTHAAARWLISCGVPTTKNVGTVSCSITSSLKGRESRKSTRINKNPMARTEAYGFIWTYKN